MNSKYVVTHEGREVHEGDVITDFRGEKSVFSGVSRGPEYNGTAKVIALRGESRGEYYAGVFDLVVTSKNPVAE